MDLPRELGEFVIVHELVYPFALNHGKVFKSFMHALNSNEALTSKRRVLCQAWLSHGMFLLNLRGTGKIKRHAEM